MMWMYTDPVVKMTVSGMYGGLPFLVEGTQLGLSTCTSRNEKHDTIVIIRWNKLLIEIPALRIELKRKS